jgi:Fur family transcriptional regulator, iron response regulator
MTNRNERQQQITSRLEAAGIRPTRQRIMLAHLLFSDQEHRHITAEELFAEARKAGERVSLATVYNTLNHFAASGLLQEFSVEAGSSYFDTNTDHHHYFLVARTGELLDIPA